MGMGRPWIVQPVCSCEESSGRLRWLGTNWFRWQGLQQLELFAGWISGQSGLNDVVAAALVSAITAFTGGGGLVWLALHPGPEHSFRVGLMLLIFALGIAGGILLGVNVSRAIAADDEIQARNLRKGALVLCSEQEYRVNKYRAEVFGLKPLPSELFCK